MLERFYGKDIIRYKDRRAERFLEELIRNDLNFQFQQKLESKLEKIDSHLAELIETYGVHYKVEIIKNKKVKVEIDWDNCYYYIEKYIRFCGDPSEHFEEFVEDIEGLFDNNMTLKDYEFLASLNNKLEE